MTYGGRQLTEKNEAMMRVGIATVIALIIVAYAFMQLDDTPSKVIYTILAAAIWSWIAAANLIPVLKRASLGSLADAQYNLGVAFGPEKIE